MNEMIRNTQQETNMSLVKSSHAGRDELVPSRYALRVGEIDVLVVICLKMNCARLLP
jgi:hypothetical protein